MLSRMVVLVVACAGWLLGALVAPAAAFHTIFDFSVDRVTVDGNSYGPLGGAPDFVDDFDDPSLPHWYKPYGTSSVHDGRLHVTNPGRHFPGPDGLSLDLSNVASAFPYLSRTAGDFVATAVFDPVIPPEGHFYHFTLFTFGAAQFFNELFGIDINTSGGVTNIEQHLVILDLNAGSYQTVQVSSQPITAADLTGQLHLRLHYDSVAGTMHSSFSLDGGSTFQAPFPSSPIFTLGRDNGQMIIGADPRAGAVPTTTATTLTPTTTTSTTTTQPWTGNGVAGTRLFLHRAAKPEQDSLDCRLADSTIDLGGGNGSLDDPTIKGGRLRLQSPISAGFGMDILYQLPASGWRYRGSAGQNRGYRYVDKTGAHGPIGFVDVMNGRRIIVRARGAMPFTFAGTPDPVSMMVFTGGKAWCATFGGTTRFVAGKSFASRGAAPGLCLP